MENEIMEPDFKTWTPQELFNHLIDLHQIPYEEEFEDWRRMKAQMIKMCEDGYEHGRI